jgi:hypothetical protein
MAERQIEQGRNELVCQKWQWKERGWNSEEDGFSLHLSHSALREFVRAYWDSMPDGPAPDEYGCPEGVPYRVRVDDETQFEVSLLGSKRYGTEYICPEEVEPRFLS